MKTNNNSLGIPPILRATFFVCGIFLFSHLTEWWARNIFGTLLWLAIFAALAFLLPLRVRKVFIVLVIVCFLGLSGISEVKSALTAFPLTFDDLFIAANNPDGVFEAIPAPRIIKDSFRYLMLILLCVAIYKIFFNTRRIWTISLKLKLFSVAFVGIWVLVVLSMSERQFAILEKSSDISGALWNNKENVKLSRKIGIIQYLNFTFHKSQNNNSASVYKIKDFETRHIEFKPTLGLYQSKFGNDRSPNIVFVLLESTVDVTRIFDTTAGEPTDLFKENKYSKLRTPMRVNAVGGGTWVTEFETITGVDSRVFGYNGYYTHSSISPYINHAFPHYLRARGYSTLAFYPVEKRFYNAGNAYRNYGFEKFFDGPELGISADWEKFTDTKFVDSVVKQLEMWPQSPFFSYIVTLENHSPHPCVNFKSDSDFIIKIRNESDFELNCRLNEFQLRTLSSYKAIEKILAFLKSTETRTGRPFILVTFGDHLPHTFASAGMYSGVSYEKILKVDQINLTDLHIYSSISGTFSCCDKGVPDFLVPTIVSSMIEPDLRKIYLNTNLNLFKNCGLDSVGVAMSQYGVTKGDCVDSYLHALKLYKNSTLSLEFR